MFFILLGTPITSKKVFDHWKDVLKKYSLAMSKYERSGQNNPQDFINFCSSDCDTLYLFLWLQHLNNPEFSSFCAHGNLIPNGK